MRYSRKGGQVYFSADLSIPELSYYLTKIIDIVSAVYISKDKRPTKREKECLIVLCIIYNNGIDDIYDKFSAKLFDEFGFKTKSAIKTWISRLVDKEWVNLQNNKVTITDYLNNISLNKDTCYFNIKLDYEADGPNLG